MSHQSEFDQNNNEYAVDYEQNEIAGDNEEGDYISSTPQNQGANSPEWLCCDILPYCIDDEDIYETASINDGETFYSQFNDHVKYYEKIENEHSKYEKWNEKFQLK